MIAALPIDPAADRSSNLITVETPAVSATASASYVEFRQRSVGDSTGRNAFRNYGMGHSHEEQKAVTIRFCPRGVAGMRASLPVATSSLVRRLVAAREDTAKQRIRAWMLQIDDARLRAFGLTPDDIAILRGRTHAAIGRDADESTREGSRMNRDRSASLRSMRAGKGQTG